MLYSEHSQMSGLRRKDILEYICRLIFIMVYGLGKRLSPLITWEPTLWLHLSWLQVGQVSNAIRIPFLI